MVEAEVVAPGVMILGWIRPEKVEKHVFALRLTLTIDSLQSVERGQVA